MPTISRKLITLDILNVDMQEEGKHVDKKISTGYLELLQQYLDECKLLLALAGELRESVFSGMVESSGTCLHITNKRMLSVQIRLLEYVLVYYNASQKIEVIQASEFGSQADRRLGLLQTKAIKARSQFKTVAKAMGRSDLQAFILATYLPEFHWGWKALKI